MAATGKTPILLYGSTIATNTPVAGNLTNSSDGCEIAINVADKNLFFKDSTNTVNTVPIRQSSASSNGWLSSTDWSTFNSKQAALVSGTNIKTVSGTSLLGSGDVGTIGTAYGGTGLTSFTANQVFYANSTSTFAQSSNLQFDGSTLAAGTSIAAWGGAYGRMQIGTALSMFSNGASVAYYGANVYNAGAGVLKYINNGASTIYVQNNGTHSWNVAASGSAGGTITFSQAMSLDAASVLTVTGNVTSSAFVPNSSTIPTNGLYLPAANSIGIATNSTNAVYINASQNVGIGNTNPQRRLQLAGTTSSLRMTPLTTTAEIQFIEIGNASNASLFGTVGVSSDGTMFVGNQNNAGLYFATNNVVRMRLDPFGILGLGIIPNTWNSGLSVIQLNTSGSISSGLSGNGTYVGQNWYNDGSDKYIGNTYALLYEQNKATGKHVWYNAPSNSSGAGAALTLAAIMALDSTGYLGLGTTSPTMQATLYGSGQAAQTSLSTTTGLGGSIGLRSSSGGVYNGGAVYFGGIQGYWAAIKGQITSGTGPVGRLGFYTRAATTDTNLTLAATIFETGGITVGDNTDAGAGNLRLGTGNLVIGTSGKGIDFSATPGTGTSELLADYEEGTWTPKLYKNGVEITSPSSAFGRYVKIGTTVWIHLYFEKTSGTSATGSIWSIGNLPFTVAAINYESIQCGYAAINDVRVSEAWWQPQASATTAYLASGNNWATSDWTTGSVYFSATGTYLASS